MKKVIAIVLTLVLVVALSGCSNKALTYYGNLGYDLSSAGYESIEFNVYHSNTDDHTWELLKTFSCSPEKEHFADVRLEGAENCITITSENNRVEKTENTVSYYTEDMDTYKFTIDGFSGWIGSFQNFEVKDTDEEQFFRLYPISNDEGGTFFQEIKIDQPYDEEEENLDNILITIRLQ